MAARTAEVESAAAMIEDRLSPIDIRVNNAMVTVVSPVAESKPDEVHRMTEVTCLGTVSGTLAALRRVRPRNRGAIVPGNVVAHGRFDAGARLASVEPWLSTHRMLGVLALAGIAGVAIGWRSAR